MKARNAFLAVLCLTLMAAAIPTFAYPPGPFSASITTDVTIGPIGVSVIPQVTNSPSSIYSITSCYMTYLALYDLNMHQLVQFNSPSYGQSGFIEFTAPINYWTARVVDCSFEVYGYQNKDLQYQTQTSISVKPSGTTIHIVPEPSSIASLLCGIGTLGGIVLKRRRSA